MGDRGGSSPLIRTKERFTLVNLFLYLTNILYKNKVELNYFFKEYILALLENLEELKLEEYAVAVSKIHEIFETPIAFVAASESFEKLFSKYECPKEYFLSLRQKR